MDNQVEFLFCKICGWSHEECGMKPVCPECSSPLYILKGSIEEVETRIALEGKS